MSDIEKLRAEIVGDPLERGYAAMTDAEVAASLNAVVVTARRLVPVEDVEYWATQQMTGNPPRPLLAVLEAARTDPLNPFYDLAVVILRAVAPGRKPWDMDAPGNLGLMVAAEAAGLLTTGQIASLRALAEYPTSRAQQLIGRAAAEYEITGALYTDAGERRI